MEDLSNGEALGSPKVDNLAVSTHHSNVGGAAVGQNLCVAHIGENQVGPREVGRHLSKKEPCNRNFATTL